MFKSKRKLSESSDSESELDNSELSDEEIGPETNRSSLKGLTKKSRLFESDGSDSDFVSPQKKDSLKKNNTLLQNDHSESDEEIVPKSNKSSLKGPAKKSRYLESNGSDSDNVSPKKKDSPKKSNTPLQNDHSESDKEIVPESIKSSLKGLAKKSRYLESDGSDSDNVSPKKKDSPKKSNTPLQNDHSDSDEEIVPESIKSSLKGLAKKSRYLESDGSDSDNVSPKKKDSPEKSITLLQNDHSDEEIGCKSNRSSLKGLAKKSINLESDASDSDIVSPKKKDSPKRSNTRLQNEHAVSSDEENLTNDSISSDNSEDEPLPVKHKKSTVKHSKVTKQKRKPKSDVSHVSPDEEDKPNSNRGQTKKTSKKSFDKIENLKKYVRAAGIRVNSYDKLFENCKSVKSKAGKLLDVLAELGLKGRPSIKKCQKLRKKIETKNEIAELDKSNIISSAGRSKRVKNAPLTTSKIENSPRKFSRLRGIIDSEEDSD